jgi:tetratricopeptide (TPR) repeat protein/uncharacterized protein HemY
LAYGDYLLNLTRGTSIDDAGRHPIFLDALRTKVSTVLAEAVDRAVKAEAVDRAVKAAGLADDDPDARLFAANQAILVQAVGDALKVYDPNLLLDAPDQLLAAARRRVEKPAIGEVRKAREQALTEALTRAQDQVLKPLLAKGASEGSKALSAAASRGILVDAMKRALEVVQNPAALMLAARKGLLEEAVQHALTAGRLTTPGRDALRSLSLREFSPEDQEAVRMAAQTELLLRAVKRALAAEDKDRQTKVPPAVLGRTARRALLVEMIGREIKGLQLADDQRQAIQDRSGALADLIRRALRDGEPASTDRALLLQTGEKAVLTRAAQEALAVKNGILSEALSSVLQAGDGSSVSSLVISRKALAAALTPAIEAAQLAKAERDLLLRAVERGVLVDVLQQVLEDSELVSEDCQRLLQPPEGEEQRVHELLARAVNRAALAVEQTLESTDREALLLAGGCSLLRAELLRAEASEAEKPSQAAEGAVQAEYAQARAYADRGIELYPWEPRMYSTAAEIASRAGEPAQAVAILDAGLTAVPKNASLLWARANMLIEAEDLGKARQAVADFREAVYSFADLQRVPPVSAGGSYLEARIAFAQEQWSAAKDGFEKARGGLRSWPTYVKQADYWAGRCCGYLQNEDQEIRAYQRALEVDPFYLPARAALADALARSGLVEAALKEYAQLLQIGTPAQGAWLRLAQLLYARNRRLPPGERDWKSLEDALVGAEQAGEDSVQYVLLRAEVSFAQAEELRDTAGKLNSPEETQQAVARAQQLTADAEGSIEDAHNQHPEQVEYWVALVGVEVRREVGVEERGKQWDRVEKLLDEATQKLGDHVLLRISRATYLTDRYRKEAAGQPQKEAAGQPQKEAAGQPQKEAADQLRKKATDQLRQLAENTDRFSPAERLQLWSTLGALAEQVGDEQQARDLWRRVAEQIPNSLPIRLQLLDLAFRSRDEAVVKSTLDEVRRIEGRGAHWLYGEAIRLSLLAQAKKDNSSLDEALKHLAEARKLRPSWSRLPLVAATIYEEQGNPAAALENYLQAINLGEYGPWAVRRAISLLYRQQRFAEADKLLSRFQEIPPELLKTAGMIDLGLGRFDQAVDKAKQAAAGSNDYGDYIWLGQLLYEKWRTLHANWRRLDADWQRAVAQGANEKEQDRLAKEVETARLEEQGVKAETEKSLQRALELAKADNVPEAWVTMILFLAGTGETKKAEEAIEQARNKIPANRRPLALAQAYEQMGRPELAEQNCEEALAAAPQDPAVARYVADFYLRKGEFPQSEPSQRSQAILQAEAILRRIIDGQIKGTQSHVLWAKRRLALIFLGRFGAEEGYQNLQQALKLVDQNLAAVGPNPEDLRLKANILVNDPAPERRQEGTRILVNLPRQQQAATPQDGFLLWQLYLAQGEWAKASEQMQSLLASKPDPRAYVVYLTAYVRALLEHKEIPSAEIWLARLEENAPNQVSTASLRAELLFQRKQYAEALDLMNRFVGKADALPADEAERTRRISLILEGFARRLTQPEQQEMAKQFLFDAETLCRKYVRERPGREWFLVMFLGRQGRIEEAVSLLESTWPESEPATTAEASLLLLRSPAATAEQLQRVERVVQGALEKFDRPTFLLEVMAQAYAAQERYGEAEAHYREVIKKNSGAYRAMNNLAVLLALQRIKLPEALSLVARAIELAGPVGSMLDSRATVYLALEQPRNALDDLEKAIKDEATPVRCFHQAQAYQQSGQRQQAAEAMKTAQKLGLKPSMLEPLERPAYQELLKLLK